MSDRIENFSSVLAAARAAGRLLYDVFAPPFDLNLTLEEDLAIARECEEWVMSTHGVNAIEFIPKKSTAYECMFALREGSWTYYAGRYYFTDLDDAVAFRLRYGT